MPNRFAILSPYILKNQYCSMLCIDHKINRHDIRQHEHDFQITP